MDTKEQIHLFEVRQMELLYIMRKSDDHAAKCSKLGRSFERDYPREYAEYISANNEYNTNEARIAELSRQAEAEDAESIREVEFLIEEQR